MNRGGGILFRNILRHALYRAIVLHVEQRVSRGAVFRHKVVLVFRRFQHIAAFVIALQPLVIIFPVVALHNGAVLEAVAGEDRLIHLEPEVERRLFLVERAVGAHQMPAVHLHGVVAPRLKGAIVQIQAVVAFGNGLDTHALSAEGRCRHHQGIAVKKSILGGFVIAAHLIIIDAGFGRVDVRIADLQPRIAHIVDIDTDIGVGHFDLTDGIVAVHQQHTVFHAVHFQIVPVAPVHLAAFDTHQIFAGILFHRIHTGVDRRVIQPAVDPVGRSKPHPLDTRNIKRIRAVDAHVQHGAIQPADHHGRAVVVIKPNIGVIQRHIQHIGVTLAADGRRIGLDILRYLFGIPNADVPQGSGAFQIDKRALFGIGAAAPFVCHQNRAFAKPLVGFRIAPFAAQRHARRNFQRALYLIAAGGQKHHAAHIAQRIQTRLQQIGAILFAFVVRALLARINVVHDLVLRGHTLAGRYQRHTLRLDRVRFRLTPGQHQRARQQRQSRAPCQYSFSFSHMPLLFYHTMC